MRLGGKLPFKFFTFVAEHFKKYAMQLPAPFVDYARALLGEAEYNRFSAALLEDEQPVSIRLNPQKWDNSSFFILHSSLKKLIFVAEKKQMFLCH